jgi:hypothetical protein
VRATAVPERRIEQHAGVPPEVEELSDRVEAWLTGSHRKTMGDLVDRFGPQSFAVLFVVLMAVPALPLPTGGLSHLFEFVTVITALQLVAGRTDVWLPKRWDDRELPILSRPAFAAALLKRIRWFEKYSTPRGARLLEHRVTTVVYGLVIVVFAVFAFFAPPFSGLDTLPSLGVVVLSLGVLFGDALIACIGMGIGAAGVALVVGLGHVATRLVW